MNLAETLAASAAEVGMKKTQGKSQAELMQGVKKADNNSLAGMLAASMAEVPKTPTKVDNEMKPTEKPIRQSPEVGEPFETGDVAKWSFSTLSEFERCKHYVRMAKVQAVPQEQGAAASRGNEIHDALELWVRDEGELPRDPRLKLENFKTELAYIKEMFAEGKVELEEQWGIRQDWSDCDWDDEELWGRMKLDVFLREDETSCRIIDYKTGRKYGNEMKHKDQGVTYALGAMHKYPELEHFQVEFWYLDEGKKMVFNFNRAMLNVMLPGYHQRAYLLTTETLFAPMPSAYNCLYCAYGNNRNKAGKAYGTGVCDFDHYRAAGDMYD